MKNFFRPKIFKKLLLRPFLVKNGKDKKFWSIFLVGIDSESSNVFLCENLYFENFFPLWLAIAIYSRNGVTCRKNSKDKRFLSKMFFGIDSEWSKTSFKTKISILKKLPLWLDLAIFSKNEVTSQKMAKTKNFSRKMFLSESIQNSSKLILKRKYRFRENFQLWLDIAIFSKKSGH